jgi:hypothetical protein
VFGASIFLSAVLLFSIQPLVGKELLPRLGGAPAVWNTVMLFFQAMLLAGYAYAHFTVRHLGLKYQPVLHLVLVIASAWALPFSFGLAGAEPGVNPAIWLLLTLTKTVGLPVFVLASTAPLVQKWFASTRHPHAQDPYFLYAASNVGSFGALFAYPLLIEPFLRLHFQSQLWSGGFWLLALLLMGCVLLRRTAEAPVLAIPESRATLPRLTILKWIGLSFVPSSLMLGVTNYITTDVASIPLLWVLPLALYLLTFVIAFSGRAGAAEKGSSRAIPILALAVVFPMLVQATEPVLVLVLLHLAFFFSAALQCHLKLARLRPEAGQLTSFYLYMSLGGVLGGVFNALLAPVIFSSITEYPLAILAATLIGYPAETTRKDVRVLPPIYGGAMVILAMTLGAALVALIAPVSIAWGNVMAGVLLLLAFLVLRRPVRYALALGTLLACTSIFRGAQSGIVERDRNFFGVLRVSNERGLPLRRLYHGTTIHGVQFRNPERRCEPLSYYHSEGPVREVAALFRSLPLPREVALIGLGAGAMITYGQPDERWTLYEIDPAVIRIAQDTNFFTYLSHCARAPFRFDLGDARLRLAKAPDHQFGLIFLDAFSSDVIPMHLLTREALTLYRQKLAPNGILAFHLSSRHFTLEPLVARLGQSLGLHCFSSTKGDLSAKAIAEGGLESNWAILAPDAAVDQVLAQATWQRVIPDSSAPLWTDDFSSLLGVLKLD